MSNRNALLIIDVQEGLDDPSYGERNNPHAESNMARLLAAWRDKDALVVHVQHNSISPNSPLRPECPGNAIKPAVAPRDGEPLFQKTVNSAFIGTGLESYLRQQGVQSLTIVGLTTDHCVSTSVRMAANLGFDVALVSDATATFERRSKDGRHYSAEDMHTVNLMSLEGEFCELQTTDEALARLSMPNE